jgi:hypothetical protein
MTRLAVIDRIQRGLQRLDARKRLMGVEQLALQGLVQPFRSSPW